MTSIACIIVGIDGWEKYTLPLIESLQEHEPSCELAIIDNNSTIPYPYHRGMVRFVDERVCYSKAINEGKLYIGGKFDWYIVLSNDVICTGPFAHILEQYSCAMCTQPPDNDLVGPLLKEVYGFAYLEGWCVCVPKQAWADWDERFLGSDFEDVAFSTAARQRGFGLVEDKTLPFTHLDQRQRYHIVEDFAGKNAHNAQLFLREYAKAATQADAWDAHLDHPSVTPLARRIIRWAHS